MHPPTVSYRSRIFQNESFFATFRKAEKAQRQSFTIASEIRPVIFHDPDGLPVQDYLMHVAFSLPQTTIQSIVNKPTAAA